MLINKLQDYPIYQEIEIESYKIIRVSQTRHSEARQEIIEIDSYKIILADWMQIPFPLFDSKNRNVYCLDKSGNMVWQIEAFSNYPGHLEKNGACYYVGMNYVDGKLLLFNACDLRVTVDYKTGTVLEKMEVR